MTLSCSVSGFPRNSSFRDYLPVMRMITLTGWAEVRWRGGGLRKYSWCTAGAAAALLMRMAAYHNNKSTFILPGESDGTTAPRIHEHAYTCRILHWRVQLGTPQGFLGSRQSQVIGLPGVWTCRSQPGLKHPARYNIMVLGTMS